MEQEEPVHKGFVLIPPAGKLVIKKTWQQKFCQLFRASKFGIDRLELYDSRDTTRESGIISLKNCIKITSKSPTYFSITTKTAVHEFNALTTDSLNEWLSAIQSVAFPDDASKITSIEEDNDLYCSSGEEIFNVKIHSSPAAQRCGLDNKLYTLVLTSTAIQLRSPTGSKLLYTWPYRYIRRYGYKSGKFTFEAGRKCESGEGTFFIEHSNQQEIFRCLASKMKYMKKLLSDSTTSLLECGDNPLQAAFSMEARSRSPLIPSPTVISIHDMEASLSSKCQITIPDLESVGQKAKVAPSKPPRKLLQKEAENSVHSSNNSFSNNSMSDYEPVDKYDRVEVRNDAWRTMGVDEVNHSEQLGSNEDDLEYMSWGVVQKSAEEPKIPKAPKVIQQNLAIDDSYDKLDFFGSTNKLNIKSTYKQVLPAPIVPVVSPPSFNEYDEVQPCLEGIRIADDSHLGYAMIRSKNPMTVKEQIEKVNHKIYNNEQYAIISKPKRV